MSTIPSSYEWTDQKPPKNKSWTNLIGSSEVFVKTPPQGIRLSHTSSLLTFPLPIVSHVLAPPAAFLIFPPSVYSAPPSPPSTPPSFLHHLGSSGILPFTPFSPSCGSVLQPFCVSSANDNNFIPQRMNRRGSAGS